MRHRYIDWYVPEKSKFVQKKFIMTTTAIREKLVSYLRIADEKKVKAIYTMVEDDINTEANDWDEDFLKEIQQRSKSFVSGSAKAYSWEETKRALTQRIKSKRK